MSRGLPTPVLSGLLLALFVFARPLPVGADSSGVKFSRQIRPILSENCFFCHGPDEKKRAAKLRLDDEDSAKKVTDGTAAVVPGNPDASLLIQRITSSDPDEVMPPPKQHKTVSPQQVELLKEWIRQGAKWGQHWSYEPVTKPAVPAMDDSTFWKSSSNPIDAFVAQRLRQEGLTPVPPADGAVLVRRIALDLTGLPPTLEELAEIRDFASRNPIAAIDHFLSKPAYGEHWARLWLDLARYADSSGYPSDEPREIWAYRDWVVRALNDNLPFDRFTIEQLAGDLLPNPTNDQLIATAFHRNTMTQNEGGTDDEEFRNAAVIDRVNTTFAVWMGTTMACAQCHSHKYDPITNKDYFQFYALLNQSADSDKKDESPLHRFDLPEQKRQRETWNRELAAVQAKLAAPSASWFAGFDAWEKSIPSEIAWTTPVPTTARSSSGIELAIHGDARVTAARPSGPMDTYTVEVPLPAGVTLLALRIEALADDSLPGNGPGHAGGNFVLSQARAEIAPEGAPSTGERRRVPLAKAYADATQGGFDPAHVLAGKPVKDRGWAVGGHTGKDHALTLVPARPEKIDKPSRLMLTLEHRSQWDQHTLGAFRIGFSTDPSAVRLAALPADVLAIVRTPVSARTAPQVARIRDYYVREIAPETKTERAQVASLTRQLEALKPVTVPVMKELDAAQRRVTKIQIRGNWQNLGEEVSADTPAAFHPLAKDAPRNRLSMARWIVCRENPLTARVTVNRLWESIFGIGIVRSTEDFGSQGELPVHPELLDWLAAELMDSGWNVKHLLRLMLSSEAYRQDSRTTTALNERDPDNRLLARGPRFRPTGELLRDQALAVSGLLSSKLYGPPVRPLAPSLGLTTAFGRANDWTVSPGEDRYRRSLYTEVRRNSPYPAFTTFDAGNREVCLIRRSRTNTPLQAFVTLNDPVFVETHQAMARRLVREARETPARLSLLFRLCLSREPSSKESELLSKLYSGLLASFAANAESAGKMATEPLGPAEPNACLPELAAWTASSSVVMNMDEFLMRQ